VTKKPSPKINGFGSLIQIKFQKAFPKASPQSKKHPISRVVFHYLKIESSLIVPPFPYQKYARAIFD